ncbi:sister-chromatid cohesion protein 3 [Histomonas meleagridis]|uniref:sister-chromatid cohesion protein 3 n=1 Tax=Histomonas meleagridis TaxID=135588 RepID=UPI00355A2169|nr:sister-chromatid cohesion protein 3 [Histomonas meleagridis]KAH0797745.1 sister-chromatid cohesion protein 3 [Histomonas meleagridis]
MPPKSTRKKKPEINPEHLPEEMTKVGPHDPLKTYFSDECSDVLFEQWADFYEKRPQIAIRELISMIPFIGGVDIEITEKQIKKSLFKEVKDLFQEQSEDRQVDSPVELYFKNLDQKAFKFWTDLCNSLIVCKGLFLDAFDIFKDWVFDFCEAPNRTLRESAIVSILAIESFLAESISKASEELDKLNSSKKQTNVTKRQIEEFTTELESSRSLSMEFFTTVIRHRFRDVDPKIRELCVKTIGEAGMVAPNDFNANILKYITKSLNDENAKIRRCSLSQIKELLNAGDVNALKSYFKTITPELLTLCNDKDNSIVVATLGLMTKLNKKKLLKEIDIKPLFKLTIDEAQNVRNASAKFITSYYFLNKIPKSMKTKNKEEINESQLREFSKLVSKFSNDELLVCIESFIDHLDCLQNWELIMQIILLNDNKKENLLFVKILCDSALYSSKTDQLTEAIIRHLSKLLKMYKDNDEALLSLTSLLTQFDINAIEGAAAENQFKTLLDSFKTMFDSTQNIDICINVINAFGKWKKSNGKQTNKVNSILKKFAKSFEKVTDDNLIKFSLFSRIYDFSQNQEIRNFLLEEVDNENDELSSTAIKTLNNIFQNDIQRLMNASDGDKAGYIEEFRSLQTLFGRKIHFDSDIVKTSAFNALGTMYMLCQFINAKELIDDTISYSFFKAFHSLENKIDSFDFLTRPIIVQALPMKFAVHAFWYIQDPELKPRVKQFMNNISDYLPVEGYELGELVRTLDYTPSKLKSAMKTLAKKVDARSAIDSWLDKPDDSLIPYYAPFLSMLTSTEAELLRPIAKGQTAMILQKIENGKKLKQKDFVYVPPKEKQVSEEEEETDEEADEEVE